MRPASIVIDNVTFHPNAGQYSITNSRDIQYCEYGTVASIPFMSASQKDEFRAILRGERGFLPNANCGNFILGIDGNDYIVTVPAYLASRRFVNVEATEPRHMLVKAVFLAQEEAFWQHIEDTRTKVIFHRNLSVSDGELCRISQRYGILNDFDDKTLTCYARANEINYIVEVLSSQRIIIE